MTTVCNGCGAELNEDTHNRHYILCDICGKYIPRGAMSYLEQQNGKKEVTKQVVREKKEKPETVGSKVRALLAQGLSVADIASQIKASPNYIRTLKYTKPRK